jgi:ABC-type sulfate transport system substrate-binding protein
VIQYTIYDHPADYPEYWVVRRFQIVFGGIEAGSEVYLCTSLEQARAVIDGLAPDLVCLTRDASDAPSIVESWL